LVDYRGPAYNEADVSDKPRHVRRKPLLKSPTFDLRTRCEQQLTIDWAAGEVNAALRRNGRLSNALEVITSDHGYLLGDHRIVGKAESYAAPVPLYMRWPAMTGKGDRTVDEPVSNVDLAPTFCALAGCSMPDAEGHSLVPIIRGDASRLERDYLYTELLNGAGCYRSPRYPRPEWSGVETTLRYSPTRWAYTLYRDGQEELYDLTHDPHRLVNVAHGGYHAVVLADVRAFREEVWQHNQRGWCRE
jgi:arylsulfatase A-like enzyme